MGLAERGLELLEARGLVPGGRRGVCPAEARSMLSSVGDLGGELAMLAELGILSKSLLVEGEGIMRSLRRGRLYTAGSESESKVEGVMDRLLGWLEAARGLGDLEAALEAALPGPAWAALGAHARWGWVSVKRAAAAAAAVVGGWEWPCKSRASSRLWAEMRMAGPQAQTLAAACVCV